MSLGEFALIDRYFTRPLPARDDVLVGIGDDGAVLRIGAGHRLISTLALAGAQAWDAVGGDASRLGHDVMAAALNRLAAVGAQAAWATLALTLEEADERWLAAFSDALFAAAAPWSVALIGGDTTRGPFCVTLVAHGLLGEDAAKLETGIGVGDGIYVSGALGAGLGAAYVMPATLRVDLGRWIRACGGVAVDLSEGLHAALAHLLAGEDRGARIELATLPLAPAARRHLDAHDAWADMPFHRGDMELAFTLPEAAEAELLARASAARVPITPVATVNDSLAVVFVAADGSVLTPPAAGSGAVPP